MRWLYDTPETPWVQEFWAQVQANDQRRAHARRVYEAWCNQGAPEYYQRAMTVDSRLAQLREFVKQGLITPHEARQLWPEPEIRAERGGAND